MKRDTQKGSRVSLKWRIFLYLLGFCLLLLVILWIFQTVLLEQFYTSIKLSQVEREAQTLAALLHDGDLETFESNVLARGDLAVELVREDGSSSTVGGLFPEGGLGPLSAEQKTELFAQARDNGGAFSTRYFSGTLLDRFVDGAGRGPGDGEPPRDEAQMRRMRNHMNIESMLHAQVVTTGTGEDILLVVSTGITPVRATVDTLRIQLLYISALMLVAAIVIALLLAKRVASPIEQLNTSAHKLAGGEYDVSFTAAGYREIEELSATLNHAADELSKTEALRRELIANVSHDLRTPLTLITGYAEMMRDLPDENNAENMQVIIDEAKRLSSLVVDLLDLSRLQSGTMEPEIEAFSLTGEIDEIITRFARFSEPEGFAVHFEKGREVWVKGDSSRIGQVVYNFLANAMTHGGDEKTITVRQTVAEGRVRIEVADTGAGISPEDMPYIWDRYYKVDKVHKRGAAGSGLGLSIVRGILRSHPGVDYGVDSRPGEGSSFWFSMPVELDAEMRQ